MKRAILLTVLAIILLTACAPSQGPTDTDKSQAPLAADSPLQDLVPPQTLTEILLDNGFHQTRNYCTGTCTSYEVYTPQTIAKVYDDGTFSIQAVASTGGVPDLQVFNLVLTQAYGEELTDWAAEHLNAAMRKEQTDSLGSYGVSMTGKENERVTITITPK
jgi:hypothetical protein